MINKTEIAAVFNRFAALASSAALLVMNLHYLGPEGQGRIGLINIGILVFASISQFIGGAGLVYLIPRKGESNYLKASIIWLIISGGITFLSQWLLSADEITAILGLGALQSFFMLCQMLLLSRNKLSKYQLLLFIQAISSVGGAAFFYMSSMNPNINDFLLAQLFSFSITALCGLIFTWTQWKNWLRPIPLKEVKEAGQLGAFTQTGNILHILNNRSFLYFLEKINLYDTGIFSACSYVSEAILTVSKSLSAVQVSRIAQSDNHYEHKKLTLKYLWIGLSATALGVTTFFLLPESVLQFVFSDAKDWMKSTFAYMIPGVIAAGCTSIIAHYFSGKGLNRYNAISSTIGFITAMISGAFLIPDGGLSGAAKAMSITFVVQAATQFYLFRKAIRTTNADEINHQRQGHDPL